MTWIKLFLEQLWHRLLVPEFTVMWMRYLRPFQGAHAITMLPIHRQYGASLPTAKSRRALKTTVTACAAFSCFVLGVDLLTPLGVADGMLYCFVVLLSARAKRRALTVGATGASSLLIGAGFLLSPSGAPLPYVLANRFMAVVLVWMVSLLVLRNLRIEYDREKAIQEREEALSRLKHLEGLIPICAWCKKIRRSDGAWEKLEEYLVEHSDAEFTHSVCPACARGLGSSE